MELPNFVNTWHIYFKGNHELVDFNSWLQAERSNGNNFAADHCGKGRYLSAMLNTKGGSNIGSLSSINCDFVAELTLAYLDLVVRGNSELADKIISGQRLHKELHSDYVAKTKCYG
ncbi:hypothetical protein K08M3_49510 [Vibrio alginolyticus]|jgi:hypothetical protein|uniref:Uncharacterized protein n=1 Tax=Vibrio alginolyticus TaxID=663 RepID=A0A1W6UF05_VIBAL|nr:MULTISPECIES: hypothetical protein [Vibrio harveyi group]ARP06461.1 hypothetical protein K04M1_49380 [Vibrio alginolyticus]ARP11566.1 hypothetical protein K04M3_49970 [Vibrio alginolyticus]ARP16647.1 hypothetical protein K04M5_49950 [Vibrio alginolyticus]ARP21666.1 hypothetical protein K05K4_49570 [Vibrio alginolyticus]ARP26747.1 hypothetical protein K06K5_49470 [Vibrio alginolyticus]